MAQKYIILPLLQRFSEINLIMEIISQIVFALMISVFGFFIAKRVGFIRKAINLGKSKMPEGTPSQRYREMLLVAFGQRKMFKRPLPALLHLCVYVGFLVINLEVLEFVIDGLLGTHRVFAPFLGGLYPLLMNVFEVLALLVLISCIVFLLRRNVLSIQRFRSAEMKGWPKWDGNLILITEIILMMAILFMNAADQQLQILQHEGYTATGTLLISSFIVPMLEGWNESSLVILERSAWWFHIFGILGFALYVTYSKHLHIFLAFPNTYYSRFKSKGKMDNMEVVTQEVYTMLGMPSPVTVEGDPGRFGAKDVTDLSTKNIMEAFSCTECGRCTSSCPANLTGKKLSPRKIMMDVRDRSEELVRGGAGVENNTLLGNYISDEEVNACTSCNACVEECPVNINPLEIILELRRFKSMEESSSPASWNMMFQNIETNFAPWKFPASDRFKWAEKVNEEL